MIETVEQLLYTNLVNDYIEPRHRRAVWDRVHIKVRDAAQVCAKSLFTNEPRGLFLFGNVGTGKTSVMSLIAMWYLKAMLARVDAATRDRWDDFQKDGFENWLGHCRALVNIDLATVTHGNLVDRLRAHRLARDDNGRWVVTSGTPEYLLRRVLIIDDLGVNYDDQAGWNLQLQQEYFDWRWRQDLPTFITTNLKPHDKPPHGIRAWSGYQRIVDRLCDPGFIRTMVLQGDSCRRADYYTQGDASATGED